LRKINPTIYGNIVEDIDGCDVGNIDGYYVGLLVGKLDGRLLAVEKKFFKKENPSLQFSEFGTSCFQLKISLNLAYQVYHHAMSRRIIFISYHFSVFLTPVSTKHNKLTVG